MEGVKLINQSDKTNVQSPDMVDASKLVDVVHEIAEQNIVQSRYFDDAQKLKLSIRNLMRITRNLMDEREDLGPNAATWKKQLTDANSKLDELMLERRKALIRHGDLKHEVLELVPYWNDGTMDMVIRNLPWSSSNQRLLSMRSPAKRDKQCATEVVDSIAVNLTNSQQRDIFTTTVRMVEASRLVDVVHDMAYQVTILYANETEAFETLGNFWNIMHGVQRLTQPGPATELISETSELFQVHYKIRATSPRLWDLTHELLELVPDSNDKTLDELIRNISWRNSRRPFDPLRLIKSRDLKNDLPEYKIGADLMQLMFRLHLKNFNEERFLFPMIDKLVEIYTPISETYLEEHVQAQVLNNSKWNSMKTHQNPLLDRPYS